MKLDKNRMYVCNSTDFRPKKVLKTKNFGGTPTTSHFFGLPEYEKNCEHAFIRCQTFLPTKLISNIL